MIIGNSKFEIRPNSVFHRILENGTRFPNSILGLNLTNRITDTESETHRHTEALTHRHNVAETHRLTPTLRGTDTSKQGHSEAGPFTGWDTWEFFPGPTAPGGPWGPIAREIFFLNFKETKKLKAFGPGR